MNIIEIEDLTKKYGENQVLNLKGKLNIEKGKVYGFLGPNGAGKSTTMNIITGYIGPTSGTVKINGFDILNEPEKAKRCVGYLPEMPPLYQDMTVKEYLYFVADLKKIHKKAISRSVDEVLKMTKLTEVQKRLIRNLSKGYKQRVGIAQAILGMPEVIILDEPTVGLDPKQIIEIRNLIKELGKNHTVILSSHILSEVSEVCDYIYIISRGEMVAKGTEETLLEQMAGDNILNLEIKGDSDDVENLMKPIQDVCKWKIAGQSDGNTTKFTIFSSRENDLREKIFCLCAKENKPILSMSFKKKSLEDIFLEMTKEYKAPGKKKRIFTKIKKQNKEKSSNAKEIKSLQDKINNEYQESEGKIKKEKQLDYDKRNIDSVKEDFK